MKFSPIQMGNQILLSVGSFLLPANWFYFYLKVIFNKMSNLIRNRDWELPLNTVESILKSMKSEWNIEMSLLTFFTVYQMNKWQKLQSTFYQWNFWNWAVINVPLICFCVKNYGFIYYPLFWLTHFQFHCNFWSM